MSHFKGLFKYFKDTGPRLALFAAIGALLALNVSSQIYQNQSQQRREDLLEKIQVKLDAAEARLTDLQKQGITLQEQNNELQQLSVCLLQIIKGGDFTDREECQAKVDDFARNNGVITENSTSRTQPAPAPNSPPQAQPNQPNPPNQGLIPDDIPGLGRL